MRNSGQVAPVSYQLKGRISKNGKRECCRTETTEGSLVTLFLGTTISGLGSPVAPVSESRWTRPESETGNSTEVQKPGLAGFAKKKAAGLSGEKVRPPVSAECREATAAGSASSSARFETGRKPRPELLRLRYPESGTE
jgi:hypothetical protein